MKDISYLKESGIDIDGALQLLGTVEMYNDTLNEFLKGIDEKFNNIKVYKDNNDLVNYSILVHSLKSDSKYLGFTKLAMLAYNHEIKSKENDIVYVNSHFMDLENELKRVLGIVKEYIGINDTTDGAILIADDSDVVRNFATKILNDKCKVFTAVNGLEAIKLINTNSNIKGLLLDLNMPEYDGFSVLDYLNRNGLFSRIKVSIITGDDEKDKITKAFAYPIMDVISKPFNVDTVNNTIDKMLS